MRQVVLDTETTGLEPQRGHRIIEIGGVELINRRLTGRHFHQYLNPEREIDTGALEVHGITSQFLADKPNFADVAGEFLGFVSGAELVMHNAPFDMGFLDHELKLWRPGSPSLSTDCMVLDTLALARNMHPGQRNSLDALCRRYDIDDSQRELHGALLDAEILADVYLAMTGGQTALQLGDDADPSAQTEERFERLTRKSGQHVRVVTASTTELEAHERRLDALEETSDGALWRRLDTELTERA
jgi:DNA polymerase-3 subunit epsilon